MLFPTLRSESHIIPTSTLYRQYQIQNKSCFIDVISEWSFEFQITVVTESLCPPPLSLFYLNLRGDFILEFL